MNKNYDLLNKALKKKNLSEIIEFYSSKLPKKEIFVCEDISITYQDLDNKINKVCNYFEKLKLKKKDVVSLYLQNSIEYIIFYFAVIRYGAIVSPIPYGLNENRLRYYLKISNSKLLISNINYSLKKIKNIIILNYQDFEKQIENFKINFISPKLKPEDTCIYYFSSGTTANPKLIKYSNLAMINCQKILFNSNFLKINSTHLCILPLGHTASLRYSIKNAILGQGKVYIYKNFWQIKHKIWKIIETKKINFVGVVPSIIETISQIYKKRKKIRHLKFIGCGSSILSEELQKKFKKKYNVTVKNIYGMSEIGVATIDDPSSNKIYGTIGKKLKGVEVNLFNEKGVKIIKENSIGEICVKTPALFSGYKSKIIKNDKKYFFKKYFRTGDLAKLERGNLKFIDRSKDIIIKGGVNISPQEIDNCISQNLNIQESASIGIKDIFFGEKIASYVVLKKNRKISQEKLIEFCREKIGDFRSPSTIFFVKNLPKTSSGKIIKRYLKK